MGGGGGATIQSVQQKFWAGLLERPLRTVLGRSSGLTYKFQFNTKYLRQSFPGLPSPVGLFPHAAVRKCTDLALQASYSGLFVCHCKGDNPQETSHCTGVIAWWSSRVVYLIAKLCRPKALSVASSVCTYTRAIVPPLQLVLSWFPRYPRYDSCYTFRL